MSKKNLTYEIDSATFIHLKNIALGYYAPVQGFMNKTEVTNVLSQNKFKNVNWTIPILFGSPLNRDELINYTALILKYENEVCGSLKINDLFEINKEKYCKSVFQTTSSSHPGVAAFMTSNVKTFIGGKVSLNASFVKKYKLETSALKKKKLSKMATPTVAFSTRNIPHIGHEYIHRLCLENFSTLGILIITGAQVKNKFRPDFVKSYYEFFTKHYYPAKRVLVDELFIPPIYAGPKEAFLQATIVQNMGYDAFVVGRDHAGCGSFYKKYASQEIFKKLKSLKIKIIAIQEPSWCKICAQVTTPKTCHHEMDLLSLNGTDVRNCLLENKFSELEKILQPEALKFLISAHQKEKLFY